MSPNSTKLLFLILNLYILENDGFLLDSDKLPLRVASFNIQRFGNTKLSRPVVMDHIVRILSRYDLVLIMEIQGKESETMDQLLPLLHEKDSTWTYAASLRLGRHSYKEQYVFLYRKSVVTLEDTYQILDPMDVYQREPYCAKIRYYSITNSANSSIIFVGLHSDPAAVKIELLQLEKDMKMMASYWPQNDGVIAMGDFNADCRYLTKIHRDELNILAQNDGFRSLISDEIDTTVTTSDCTYDRLIVYGNNTSVKNAQVYNFQTDLNLSHADALNVSDHFPIEFQLY